MRMSTLNILFVKTQDCGTVYLYIDPFEATVGEGGVRLVGASLIDKHVEFTRLHSALCSLMQYTKEPPGGGVLNDCSYNTMM